MTCGNGLPGPIRRPRFALAPAHRGLDDPGGHRDHILPILLASGQITRGDAITVELHQPLDTPAVILIRWPPQPSVVAPNPKGLASIAGPVVRILAAAQARLAAIRAERM